MSSENIVHIAKIDRKLLTQCNLLVCNSSTIRCKNLIELRARLQNGDSDTVIVMPETDLEMGSSGYAKAQILASIPGVVAVVAAPEFSIKKILDRDYSKNVTQLGEVSFNQRDVVQKGPSRSRQVYICKTNSEVDLKFIETAKFLAVESDCWWRPTTCLFVRDEKLIAQGNSINVWKTDCCSLGLSNKDIDLNPGERILFCNAIHAEKAGIADAAKRGVSLNGSTAYLTTGPCEDCAQEIIQAGVTRVVFELNPPDNEGLFLLNKNNVALEQIEH